MLMCHVKGCNTNNYPLRFDGVEVSQTDADFNEEFMTKMLLKLDWPALVQTAFSLGVDQLPDALPETVDSEFLKRVHHVIMETAVKEGNMICNGCGHIYPIKDGIPNMLLQETEV